MRGLRVPFYSVSSDQSPAVAHFYRTMEKPKAAILTALVHPETVKVLIDRNIDRHYVLPGLREDDLELQLLNKALQELTGAPVMFGVSDAGSLAWRTLVGLGCKRICLIGYDYGEPADRPFEQWTLHKTYLDWMKAHDLTKEEMFKQSDVREIVNSKNGARMVTDKTWDDYRTRLRTLIKLGEKQGIRTINASESGTIDFVDCISLKTFLSDHLGLGSSVEP